MVDYNELWSDICFKFEKCKNCSEEVLQNTIEEGFLEKLGWSQRKGDIKIKASIPIGSAQQLIPDILVRNDAENLFVIEIKRIMSGFSERHELQLISYMLQLKLRFGILLGKSLILYYDNPNDNKNPIKVCEIQFVENNHDGIDFIKLISKENFNKESLIDFCERQIKRETIKIENEKQITFLCSNEGKKYIKEKLLSIEYPEEVINELEIEIKRKSAFVQSIDLKIKSNYCVNRTNLLVNTTKDIDDLARREFESIQDWVKRILIFFFEHNYISDYEIEKLHDKEYCKFIFGIQFPLLCDNYEDTIFTGHSRYWTRFMLEGKYFVCSEWWKASSDIYEDKINTWINKILKKR